MQMPADKPHSRGLMLIAAFKLLKGFALIAVGVGALHLLHKDVAAVADHWVNAFRVDPHNRFILWVLAKLPLVNDKGLKELSVGTFLYAAIFLTEGTGLALRKRWAEYLTIITTSSFLPWEVYEIIHHATVAKSVALVINIAVVVYLVWELRRTRKPRPPRGILASAKGGHKERPAAAAEAQAH